MKYSPGNLHHPSPRFGGPASSRVTEAQSAFFFFFFFFFSPPPTCPTLTGPWAGGGACLAHARDDKIMAGRYDGTN